MKWFIILLVACGVSAVLSSSTQGATPPRHVVIIVMENKSYGAIIGNSKAPYINSLAKNYALATQYYAQRHPSLPNYIELVAGSNMGITDDHEWHVLSGMFVGRQLYQAGYSNAIFAESMPSWEMKKRPCKFPTDGKYAKRHVPYAFFDWVEGLNGYSPHCQLVQVFGNFHADQLKGLSILIPNLCNDMHDCGISTGDTWLKNHVPNILNHMHNGDFIAILWDEGSNGDFGGGHVAAVFAGPGSKKSFRDGHFYNHDSMLKTIQNIFHLSCIRNTCNVASMSNMLQ